MSGNCELRRGLRRREKNATPGGEECFEKPAPDARAAPPEAHESLISRTTVTDASLTGLFFSELRVSTWPRPRCGQSRQSTCRVVHTAPIGSREPVIDCRSSYGGTVKQQSHNSATSLEVHLACSMYTPGRIAASKDTSSRPPATVRIPARLFTPKQRASSRPARSD